MPKRNLEKCIEEEITKIMQAQERKKQLEAQRKKEECISRNRRIIEQLEKGVIPWKRPWTGVRGTFNRISRKPYSVLNQLLLEKTGEYATFKQWTEIGGRVKKGEKGETVVFWKLQEVKDSEDEDKIKQIPILRYYYVFHISQIENVLPLEKEERFDTEPIEQAETVLQDYIEREQIGLELVDGGNQAYYSPSADRIVLPALNQFRRAEEFYSTAFHEASHSTLKKGRCNREAENMGAHFGNDKYSKEELVAEISSAFILHTLGIETAETFSNSTAYIQNWLQVLKNDKKFIVSASIRAEKSAKYIMNLSE